VEALVEVGVRLGARRRIELSVVGGAGRPLWHAEARIAVRIVISESLARLATRARTR